MKQTGSDPVADRYERPTPMSTRMRSCPAPAPTRSAGSAGFSLQRAR